MMTMKIARRKALQQRLTRLPDDALIGVRKALTEAGAKVSAAAKSFVPVDTGNLRDSIRWEWQQNLGYGNQKALAIVIGPDVRKIKDKMTNLPRWVEFGTHGGTKGQKHHTLVGGKGGKVRSRLSYRTHPGTPARPFLFPAWEMHKQSSKANVAVQVRLAIRTGLKQPIASND